MGTFKVMQFNMQFGQIWDEEEGDNAPIDLDLTIADIRRCGADIILLQEVEHAQPNGKLLEPPPNYTRLSAALKDYHGYFAYPKADPRELPFGIGLAIFSNTATRKLSASTFLPRPSSSNSREKKSTLTDRLLIGAKITVHGHELNILSDSPAGVLHAQCIEQGSPQQREMVIERLRQAQGPTLILAT